MPTVYLVWDRKERKIVGGPFNSTADATSFASRVRAKNPETHGGAKLLDNVSVTVP
jgi:hypothetical protein